MFQNLTLDRKEEMDKIAMTVVLQEFPKGS
jgi:hypothetical protein